MRKSFLLAILFFVISSPGFSQSADEYIQNGNAKYVLNDYAGAIAEYSKALEIKPKDADILFNRGLAKNHLEDYTGAIEDYTQAIEVNPNDAEFYYRRGVSKSNFKGKKSAISDFSKAIELDHAYAGIYEGDFLEFSVEYCNMDLNGEIEACTIAIEINPNSFVAYEFRGIAKGRQKDYIGSIVDFNKALEINPKFTEAYSYRGLSNYFLHNYNDAIADYDKVIEVRPKSFDDYFHRGLSKIEKGEKEAGCMDLNKAKDLGDLEAGEAIKNSCK